MTNKKNNLYVINIKDKSTEGSEKYYIINILKNDEIIFSKEIDINNNYYKINKKINLKDFINGICFVNEIYFNLNKNKVCDFVYSNQLFEIEEKFNFEKINKKSFNNQILLNFFKDAFEKILECFSFILFDILYTKNNDFQIYFSFENHILYNSKNNIELHFNDGIVSINQKLKLIDKYRTIILYLFNESESKYINQITNLEFKMFKNFLINKDILNKDVLILMDIILNKFDIFKILFLNKFEDDLELVPYEYLEKNIKIYKKSPELFNEIKKIGRDICICDINEGFKKLKEES